MFSLKSGSKNTPFELSPIKQMELAASRIPDVISLAQGIPSFHTPTAIKDYVYEKIRSGSCDKYSLTIGLSELREEIALALQKEDLTYDPDSEILITAGSIEGITASLIASTTPGDEVLLPSPSYASYLGGISMAGCKACYVPLNEDEYFDFDVEAVRKAITSKTKVLLYCTPNNPTGTLFSEEKTKKIVELAEEHNLTIIVDEVYKDFYYTDDPHFSPAHIPEARDRLIRACSFSKAYAMTGWRVGFLVSTAERVRKILKYHDAMVTCAPVVSQYAAIAALKYGDSFLSDFVGEFRKRRDMTIAALDELSEYVDYQIPRATYFVFPRLKDTVPLSQDSHAFAYDMLEKAKVAVVPGSAFGPSGERHLRINFGRDREELEIGLERIANYLNSSPAAKKRRNIEARPEPESPMLPAPSLTQRLLSSAARVYLKRNKPLIVAIAGVRGKTTCKRILTEALSEVKQVRCNALSYNTAMGLPLAILNLQPPTSAFEKLYFCFQLLSRILFSAEPSKVLILEYGISQREDARRLLRIATPDWLVLTGVTLDPSISKRGLLAGLREVASKVNRTHILYPKDDEVLCESLKDLLLPENGLALTDYLEEKLESTSSIGSGNFVGTSATYAALVATRLTAAFKKR